MIALNKKIVWLIALVAVFTACAKTHVAVHITCPPEPVLERVEVINGQVNADQLGALKRNTIKLWDYIHKLETLGCVK